MSQSKRVCVSLFAGVVLTLATLMASSTAQAANEQEIEFNEGSRGGVEIKFRNGCWISYDKDAKRGGHAGYCSPPQYQQADEAARTYLNSGGGSHDSPIPQSQMERDCQAEASAELGTRPANISTNAVHKRGSDFVVTGQSPQSGNNVTVFECVYGKRGMWKGFKVTDRNSNSGGNSHSEPVPQSQMERDCQGEASAELGTRTSNISVESVRKRGSDFVVTGQTPRSGYNVTVFECTYGKRGMWKGFKVTDRNSNSGGNSHSEPVLESQMERDCQDTASTELSTQSRNISTQPVRKRGGDFVVTGQTPRSGYNVIVFECLYGKRGMWKGFKVTERGQNNSGGYGSDTIPRSAQDRCLEMFGERADVTNVSPLRPGYWEVIMQSKSGRRSVACTITGRGEIQQWTELN